MRGLAYLALTAALLVSECALAWSPALVMTGCATPALRHQAQTVASMAGPLDELGAVVDQRTSEAAEQALLDRAKRDGLTREWATAELAKVRSLRAAYQRLRDAYVGDVKALDELAHAWAAMADAARATGVNPPPELTEMFAGAP
jgi:hypothetical protein